MLEKFHISHQTNVFLFDIDHFISDDLSISFARFPKTEIKDLYFQFNIIDSLFTFELVFLDPLLKFWDIIWLNEYFWREFV
jgi:hypothetical protein